MADPQRHRAGVHRRQAFFEQVRHHEELSGCEDLLRNLSARLEPGGRQRHVPDRPRQLQLQRAALVGEHDEAALRAGGVDGRVEHEREHFIEDAVAAHLAEALEQRGDLPEIADNRCGRAVVDGGRVGEQERQRRADAPALDPVAMGERPLCHALAIDEGAVAGAAIADHESFGTRHDLGVVA